jgi:hypothetical protein
VVSYTASEKISLGVSVVLIAIGMVGSVYSSYILNNEIMLSAFAEIMLVAVFTLLFLSFVVGVFPANVKADSIFYSGLGKEPYISDNEVYQPRMPLAHVALLTGTVVVFLALQITPILTNVPIYIDIAVAAALIVALAYFASERRRQKPVKK